MGDKHGQTYRAIIGVPAFVDTLIWFEAQHTTKVDGNKPSEEWFLVILWSFWKHVRCAFEQDFGSGGCSGLQKRPFHSADVPWNQRGPRPSKYPPKMVKVLRLVTYFAGHTRSKKVHSLKRLSEMVGTWSSTDGMCHQLQVNGWQYPSQKP